MAKPRTDDEAALILKQPKIRRDFQERIEGEPGTLFGTDKATGQGNLLEDSDVRLGS